MLTRPLTRPLTGGITRALASAGSAGTPIDLFVIVGQSNAEGRGDSSLSPAAPNGVYVTGSTVSAPLADPVGGATSGSMWPAFSNEWFTQTGRKSAFVESATGGTALTPDTAGSNWSPSGTLRGAAVTAAQSALGALPGAGYTVQNVYFVWSQGEQDAVNAATEADYEQALEDLAAYFKAQVPQMVTMLVVQTGVDVSSPSQIAAYAAIRKAQEDACTDSANLVMGYRGTYSFGAALPTMASGVHYTQAGYNLAGKCAARELALGPTAIPAAPALLSTNSYADPSYASKGSRTVAHTTASGTHCLLIAATNSRNDNNSTQSISSVTFGGVAMTLVGQVSSGGGVGNGYIRIGLYKLTEADYGGSLSGVTANVVVTASATNTRMLDWCAFNLDKDCIADYLGSYAPSPAGVSSGIATSTSNAPALWITVGGSAATRATVLTATLTNATEVMDHGVANAGVTHVCQFVAGYSNEAAIQVNRDVTADWGSTCDAMAIATFVLRGKVSGE